MTAWQGPQGASHLVGRSTELAALGRAVDAAVAGRFATVLVVGEAGIGKTRLVAETAARASDIGAAVAWSTAWEPGGAPPYWHWVQVLRDITGRMSRQALTVALGGVGDEVARLVQHHGRGDTIGKPPQPEGDDARFRMFDGITELLSRAAARDPLVLVLDDLHAADAGSLALLRFVVGDSRVRNLAILATSRDRETQPMSAPVSDGLDELARRVVTLRLGGLSDREVLSLLEEAVGNARASQIGAKVAARSAGNPLFVRELAMLLSGAPELGERPLPSTIRTVIEERVRVLPESTLEILRVGALVGEEFSAELVADVTGHDAETCLVQIDRARTAGVVAPHREATDCFVFSHGLIRELLAEQMVLPDRARTHRRIGEALERRCGPDPPLAELAHHYAAGVLDVDDGKAAEFAERAGLRAAEQLAYEEAADHLRRAVAALDRRPGAAPVDRTIDVLLSLGDVLLRTGDIGGAREVFVDTADRARRAARPHLLARAALGLGSGLDGFEVRLFDGAQISLLEEALDGLGPEPSALRAWATARLSVALTFAETPDRRRELAGSAVAIARSSGDPGALAYALGARCDAISGPEHIDDRFEAATEMLELARASGDRGMELLARRNLIVATLERGDVRAVDAAVDGYEMVAGVLRQPLYQWYVALWRGMRALMEGRVADAHLLADETARVGSRVQSHNAALSAEILTWNTLLYEGRLREGSDGLARQLALADGIYGESFWVALVAPREHPLAARAALDRLAATGFTELPRDAIWLAAMTYASDTCGLLGDARIAETLYDLVLPFEHRFAVDGIGAACYGSMARPLGVLATTLGRSREARRHFDDAIATHRSAGASGLLAQTLLDAGRSRQTFQEIEAARAAIDEAVSLFDRLGLDLRVEEALAIGPGGAPSTGQRNLFRLDGAIWTLTFSGTTVRVPDAKGLHDIATLLAHPGSDVHVADLIASTDPAPSADRSTRDALLRGDDGQLLLDATARAAYRDRLLELRDELDEAEANADLGRAEAARVEMDAIAGELAASLGLGGRSRSTTSPAERARKAVTQRIRNAVRRLEATHPALATHLDRSLRTGRFCSYRPEHPIDWSL